MHTTQLDDYADKFENIRFDRDSDGILQVTFHTNGSDVVWAHAAHEDMAAAWDHVGRDPENRVIIVTGTGDTFIHNGGIFSAGNENWVNPERWKRILEVGRRLVLGHLDIEVPMIAAVNGHATLHSEQALLCDVVIAAEGALFADRAHFGHGVVPGDGIQVIWSHLIGLNRARYMFLTGQEFTAEQALELGVVNEVLPAANVLPRAYEIARDLVAKPTVALKSVRMLMVHELRKAMSDGVQLGLLAEGLAGIQYWPSR